MYTECLAQGMAHGRHSPRAANIIVKVSEGISKELSQRSSNYTVNENLWQRS